VTEAWLTPLWSVLREWIGASAIWCAAMVVGVLATVESARRSRLDTRRMYWTAVCGVLVGLYGSHLLGLVVYGDGGVRHAWAQPWEGGKAWYGGLLGGALGVFLFLRLRRGPILAYADAVTPAVALGYAIGRIGCFVNGDDFGVRAQSAFAVRYGADTEAFHWQSEHGWLAGNATTSLPVVPVQLFHTLAGLVLFALLWRPREQPGRRLGLLALGYGVERFLLEHWRGDFRPLVGPLSMQQLISLFLLIVGAALWLRGRNLGRAPVAALG
jgi:phosphatidylglycerol---prolipoprotein diacylglyceryl transferase